MERSLDQIPPRSFSISENKSKAIEAILNRKYNCSLVDSKKLASAVLRLSDHFKDSINDATKGQGSHQFIQTPWAELWCQLAYLVYFNPLNEIRMRAVLEQTIKSGIDLGPLRQSDEEKEIDSFIIGDFGAGLGASANAWNEVIGNSNDEDARATKTLFIEYEPNSTARTLLEDLRKDEFKLNIDSRRTENEKALIKSDCLILSYSLLESTELPSHWRDAETLIIVEPSTRQQGRGLLKMRQHLIEQEYQIVAPCTHQDLCPLFIHSEKDWCHDRIHFDRPEWLREIEQHLPMRNATLTMSYIVATKPPALDRRATNQRSRVRVTGDLLEENGKNRQLVCRNSNREFLTWLHRDWKGRSLPIIPRGELIDLPESFETKGAPGSSELRLKPSTSV